ncbi:hypothetical protein [Halomonas salipaludis]|nr:hypothetical protein [Halomonas salipaludis]
MTPQRQDGNQDAVQVPLEKAWMSIMLISQQWINALHIETQKKQ